MIYQLQIIIDYINIPINIDKYNLTDNFWYIGKYRYIDNNLLLLITNWYLYVINTVCFDFLGFLYYPIITTRVLNYMTLLYYLPSFKFKIIQINSKIKTKYNYLSLISFVCNNVTVKMYRALNLRRHCLIFYIKIKCKHK